MNLSAVLLARAVLVKHMEELDSRGQLALGPLVKALADRYSFGKVPQKPEELENRVELLNGKWRDKLISKLTIEFGGVSVDTRSSTDDSEAILDDMLAWGVQTFGLTYKRSSTEKRSYASQVVFDSDIALDSTNAVLRQISERVTQSVNAQLRLNIAFETTGFIIGYDTLITRLDIPAFRIERRATVPFEENRYFSQAPMRTQEHIELLEMFEAALKPSSR